MPKQTSSDKHFSPRKRARGAKASARGGTKVNSVKELLAKIGAGVKLSPTAVTPMQRAAAAAGARKLAPAMTLARIKEQGERLSEWQQLVMRKLPAELAAHVTGVVERNGALVVFADSSGWAVRLKYALEEVKEELRTVQPGITQVLARVMPGRKA